MQNWNQFPDHRNLRILLIDDNPDIHDDFRKILSGEEEIPGLRQTESVLFDHPSPVGGKGGPQEVFEVDSAYQGQQGLEMVERAVHEGRPYAMAFVDVRMPPGWDGVETIAHIWKKYPQLQVVICTAHSDYSWEDIVRTLGASDNLVILKKPFDNIEVLQLAHSMTKKWQLTQQANTRLEDLDRMVRARTAELEAANERFSKAFRGSPLPIAICRVTNASFLDVNESFLKLLEFDRDLVIGQTETDLQIWAEAEDRSRFWAVVNSQHSVREMRCRLRARGGSIREVLVFAEVLQLEQEQCLLVLFHDVTERLKLEEELRHSQKMEAVGQLAAGVAHDFNNLLTVIRGHAELRLAMTGLDPELNDSLRQISRASERAASLTRQLLAFSRRHMMQFTSLDLNELIVHLRDMIESLIGEDIQLRCDFATMLPPILADRWSIEQVLVNIIVNARDAMPEGGRLIIKTKSVEVDAYAASLNPESRPGTFVCLTIEDTGCGMDAQTLSRIFEPFFTTKPIGKGTGMGLAMVYGIIKQHKGWIKASSVPGTGTLFEIYLPLSLKPLEQTRETQNLPLLPGGNETILIVEDNAALRGMATNVLNSAGYHVLYASSGTEALAVWSSHHESIDLLFSDVVMPEGIDGPTLAQNLRSFKPALKVILTSGHESRKNPSNGYPGAIFVAKPYSASDLLKTVRTCLDTGKPCVAVGTAA